MVLSFLGVSLNKVFAAGPPSILSYQGRLTNASGSLLGGSSGTTFYFKFSIWSAASGGAKLWPASDPTSYGITVREGVFNVNIGDTTNGYPDTLNYDFSTSTNVFLKVEVSDDDVDFETLTPRQQINSVAFAQVAGAVVSASSTIANLTGTNATTTNATSTNFFSTTASSTNLFSAAITSGSAIFANLLVTSSSTLQNFTFTNATGTSATTTNLFSTTASSSNLFTALFNGAGLATCQSNNVLTWSGGIFGCETDDNTFAWTPISYGTQNVVATSTGLWLKGSPLGLVASSTFATYSTSTNATSTNFFSTIASSTSLFTSALTVNGFAFTVNGAPTLNDWFDQSLKISDGPAFSTIDTGHGGNELYAMDQNVRISDDVIFDELLLTGSSTLRNFTFLNATGTSATTTNFFATNASSTNLFTTRLGIGTSNPSSALEVNGDIRITANSGGRLYFSDSSTQNSAIVSGSGITSWSDLNFQTGGIMNFQTGNGLGTATTTHMVLANNGNIGIGTTTPGTPLAVTGAGVFTGLVTAPFFNATSTTDVSNFQQVLVLASSTLQNFTFLNATGTSATTTSFFATVLNATTASTTNLLVTSSSTLQNFTFTNATGTSATTTNLFSTTASSSNLFTALFNGAGLATCQTNNVLTWSGGIFGCETDDNTFAWTPTSYGTQNVVATSTGLWLKGSPLGLIASSTFATYSTSTNATSTNFFATTASSTSLFAAVLSSGSATLGDLLLNSSSTLQNFTFLNATGTNATTTNIFSTTASSTNLFTALFNGAGLATCQTNNMLTWAGGTFGCEVDNDTFEWTPTAWGNSTSTTLGFSQGFLSTASSTIDSNLIITGNSTTTNATTTNIFSTTASSTGLFAAVLSSGSATFGDLLINSSSTLQNFTFLNATGTNATTTNIFSTTASTTNFFGADLTPCTSNNVLTWTGGKFGCEADDTGSATFGKDWNIFTVGRLAPTTTVAVYVGATTTASLTNNSYFQVNATSTTGDLIVASSSQDFTGNFLRFLNAAGATLFSVDNTGSLIAASTTFTNATSTNLFSTTASSSNLYTALFNGAGLATCQTNNVLTWAGGEFGCEADDSGSAGFGKTFEMSNTNFLAPTTTVSVIIGSTTTPDKSALFQVNATGTTG
ncbi:MAG: hypothetical protein Q7R69_00045, partial [bacterium]|nr:hypothetical protein [bacterium]